MKRDGITLFYQDLGDRDAPALVFVHGLGCDSTVWSAQAAHFAADHRVLAVDLPGFGRSDKPHDREYTLAWFARALQWVLEDARVEKPVLVGHSMGFSVVRRHVLDYPGTALALCDVDGFFFRNPVQAQLYTLWKQAVDFIQWPFVTAEARRRASLAQFIEYTFYGRTPEPLREEIRRRMRRTDEYVLQSCWRNMFASWQWTPATIEIPTFILYAKTLHSLPDAEMWFRSYFPRMVYREWDDAGHYMMLEQPERFNAELGAFVDRVENGGESALGGEYDDGTCLAEF